MHPVAKAALGVTALGVACVAYGAGYEVRSYRLRRVDVPVLAPGQSPFTVLHISDLHLTPTPFPPCSTPSTRCSIGRACSCLVPTTITRPS